MKLNEKKFKAIVFRAFGLGEIWGVTYSGWFEPSKEDRTKQLNEALEKCRLLTNSIHQRKGES